MGSALAPVQGARTPPGEYPQQGACRSPSNPTAPKLGVHRDLKPENLFVARRESGEDWCKILDFGIAKMESGLATTEGTVVGTARYMAPEQLADSDKVGPTTDIYALGAILYECLSGQPLHHGSTVQEVMFRVMNQAPVPLLSLCPHLPPELGELVARATAKRQCDRPQSADELAALLSAACGAASAENPTVPEVRARRPAPGLPRARPWRLAVVVAASCAVLSAAWVYRRFTKPMAVALEATTATFVRELAPNEPGSPRPALTGEEVPISKPTSANAALPTFGSLAAAPSLRVNAKKRTIAPPSPKPVGSTLELPAEGRFDPVDPYAK